MPGRHAGQGEEATKLGAQERLRRIQKRRAAKRGRPHRQRHEVREGGGYDFEHAGQQGHEDADAERNGGEAPLHSGLHRNR